MRVMTTLRFLDFDYSEDHEGQGTWDAMASVLPAHLPELLQELTEVLDWAHQVFAGVRGPMEEGGDWDYELQGVQEVLTPLQLDYREEHGGVQLHRGAGGAPRHTITLSISASAAFSQALRERFALED